MNNHNPKKKQNIIRKNRKNKKVHTTISSKSTTSLSKSESSLSNNKFYFCKGCKKKFHQYKSPSQFIKKHMEMNITCKKAIIYCECCKNGFLNKSSLFSHLSKSNLSCRQFYDNQALCKSIASSYSTSEVNIRVHQNSNLLKSQEFLEEKYKNLPITMFAKRNVTKISHDIIQSRKKRSKYYQKDSLINPSNEQN